MKISYHHLSLSDCECSVGSLSVSNSLTEITDYWVLRSTEWTGDWWVTRLTTIMPLSLSETMDRSVQAENRNGLVRSLAKEYKRLRSRQERRLTV